MEVFLGALIILFEVSQAAKWHAWLILLSYFWSFERKTLLGDNPDPKKSECLQRFTLVMHKCKAQCKAHFSKALKYLILSEKGHKVLEF